MLQEIPFHPQSHPPSFLATVPGPLHCLLLPPTMYFFFLLYPKFKQRQGRNGRMNGVHQEGSPFLTTLFIYPFTHSAKNYWALATKSIRITTEEKPFLGEKRTCHRILQGFYFLFSPNIWHTKDLILPICQTHERNRWGIMSYITWKDMKIEVK